MWGKAHPKYAWKEMLMTDAPNKQRQLANKVASNANELEREALLRWVENLLEIKDRDLPARKKAKDAIQATVESKIILPAAKLMWCEVKRLAWDERGTKGRSGLIGISISVMLFGGQGVGIAAFGTAIGVPLWIVFGTGGVFAGMLIEELSLKPGKSGRDTKTTYSVIDAEKGDKNT
jgi:hypothetical protein